MWLETKEKKPKSCLTFFKTVQGHLRRDSSAWKSGVAWWRYDSPTLRFIFSIIV